MSLFNRVTVFFSAILLGLYLQSTKATNAYIYYTDATCDDSVTISGTFNLGYDESWLEGLGFSMEDTGECIYFNDGYIDISNGYYDTLESMLTGYCVECNGVAGCSSTEDSCDDVKTTLPENVPIYQMSLSSMNDDVQGSNKYQSTSSSKESNSPAYQKAQVVQKEAMRKIYESGGSDDSSIAYTVLGGVVGIVSLFSLVAVLEGARQWREKKDRTKIVSGITESFAPDGVFA